MRKCNAVPQQHADGPRGFTNWDSITVLKNIAWQIFPAFNNAFS
jgi:hypothetical protein